MVRNEAPAHQRKLPANRNSSEPVATAPVVDSTHLDAPVIKVERQAVPMTQRVTQGLRRVALLRKVSKLGLKPLLQGCSQRPGMRLSPRAALVCAAAIRVRLQRQSR
ncbi:hypothetical protein ACVIHI_008826 [Bradyrhizobium sp. USDA 4524]|nr:hypothetical protein [Bradyrhizobium sp. USDA 4538]MCP1906970.1 hypothetical protein [Bradyrhizobium sp. USDA 4537]MCP1985446.1 hypothetical protein [Bradyrhizobium sp. USDA 4539]